MMSCGCALRTKKLYRMFWIVKVLNGFDLTLQPLLEGSFGGCSRRFGGGFGKVSRGNIHEHNKKSYKVTIQKQVEQIRPVILHVIKSTS